METVLKKIPLTFFHIAFGVILLVSAYIRFAQIAGFDFPFTYDQARDMLDIRVLGNLVDLKVSGPTTSITGLNLGPYYYLVNLPAYWVGMGNPQFLNYWNILLFLGTAIAVYLFFLKRNILLGFLIASFFLMAPQLFTVTRYFWNAHYVVYLIVFYFLSFWFFIEKRTPWHALLFGLAAGLVIQFEAAFGSMMLVFAFLVALSSRNIKVIRNFLIASLPWFLPQIAYEALNGFQMTKRFLGIYTGANPILGDKLPLSEVIPLHIKTISSFFEGQFMLPFGGGLILLIVALAFALTNKKYQKHTLYFLSFISFTFLYYAVIYRHELKPWYLEGIRVWYCFVVAIGIVSITKYKLAAVTIVTLFVLRSFYLTTIDQYSYIADNGKSTDPKNAKNIITSIDWVYEKAEAKGFNAYNYVPEVYDFPEQYMYAWYGKKNYGYTPAVVSYSLAPVPEYIRSEQAFIETRKENTEEKVALIYETIGDYETWLTQFNDYCVLDSKEFPYHVTVEWREKCSK